MGLRSQLRGAASVAISNFFEERDSYLPRPASGRPILLFHGFGTSSRVLLPLERQLKRRLRRPVLRVDLGLGLRDIRASARRAHAALRSVAAVGGFEYADVVAHSMGGLVASYLLKCLDRGRCLRSVITLGTPHQGTPMAIAGIVFFGLLSRAVWQMLPGSPLLRRLAKLSIPNGSQLIAVAAHDDLVVPAPYACVAERAGQRNALLPRTSHFELLHAQSAIALVCALL
jgi:triacylglycerol esterase/lipase EstA (alpha/beta hydrolase family)